MNGNMSILLIAGGLGVALLAFKGFGDKAEVGPVVRQPLPTYTQPKQTYTFPAQAPTAPARPNRPLITVGEPEIFVGVG